MSRHITTHAQLLLDRERLAIFIREIKRYRTTWGIPPDKVAFRDAWRATQPQREFSLNQGAQHAR